MSAVLRALTREARQALAAALESARLVPPYTELALQRWVGAERAGAVSSELRRIAELGATPAVLREMVNLVDGAEVPEPAHLVWSGPEDESAETRDTGVVVRELFESAERRVLIAGFAVYQGKEVFETLATKMDADPKLDVRMYLNIARAFGDTSDGTEIVRRFGEHFRAEEWPGERRPEIFYDPRALAPHEKGTKLASLHAKCIVVDGTRVFVTSANFTEAAQERNIEVGVLLEDPALARKLESQFDRLVTTGHLKRLPSG